MISLLEKNKWISWTFTILLFGFIFYVSSLTFELSPAIKGKPNITPIVYHISIFFLLAIFLFISVLNREWDFKKILLVVIISGIYGVLDEFHQYFVPGRASSIGDMFLDFSGVVLASMLYFVMIAWKNKFSR